MAFMRSFATDDSIVSSCHTDDGHFDSSCGLRNNAGGVVLSPADGACNRNMAPSAEIENERDRSILEQLIAVVMPIAAAEAAFALLKEFGSLGATLAESKEAQRRVIGDHEAVISLLGIVRTTMLEGLRSQLVGRSISSTDQTLIDYLCLDMGTFSKERLRVLFLNRSNHLLQDEIITEGTICHLQFFPRTIFKRAFELNASGIILVHNHPGGSAMPSQGDVRATRSMVQLGKTLDVIVRDHIIIANNQWNSFLGMGLL